MYGLLLEDRDVWLITRGQRCMAYNQMSVMNGLLLDVSYEWVITEVREYGLLLDISCEWVITRGQR